jgi:hypothetical protein
VRSLFANDLKLCDSVAGPSSPEPDNIERIANSFRRRIVVRQSPGMEKPRVSNQSKWTEEYLLSLPQGEYDWMEAKGRKGLDLACQGWTRMRFAPR